jgi:hypothetical protein
MDTLKKIELMISPKLVMLFLVFLIILCITTASASGKDSRDDDSAADPNPGRLPINVGHTVWIETNTKRYDYVMYVTSVNYGMFHLRYDFFDRDNFKRAWFNYGNVPIVRQPAFTIDARPGIGINNKDNFYYGSDISVNFPCTGFSVLQRSYAGIKGDLHYSFFNQRIADNLNIQYYRLARTGISPDTYLGPRIFMGPVNVFYGISPNRPGAQNITISGSYSF